MRCPAHPDRPALSACTVCGVRHCRECAPDDFGLGAALCADCRMRIDRLRGAPSPTASVRPSRATLPPSWTPRRPLRPYFLPLLLAAVGLTVAATWIRRVSAPRAPAASEAFAALEQTGAALELHRARTGAFPDSLHALIPTELPSLPSDPFAPGQPLRYARSSFGLALWSLGPDGVDQEGSPVDPVTGRGDLLYPVE